MGCLKITYNAEESPLRVSRDEKEVPENWQVWVNESGEKEVKEVIVQTNGGVGSTDQSLQGFEFTDQEVQDNLKFHSKGALAKGGWTTKALGPVKFQAGQIVKMKMTNTNVLPVVFTVKWANPAYQDPSTHYLLPGQSATVNGAIFTAEPTLWNFSVDTPSDVLMLQYQIFSTWVPGDPPNR